jgi:hypothetical protein
MFTIEHPLARQILAAALTAGALLAIPTPVAAGGAKESHVLHPAGPTIHGLVAHTRLTESARPAPPVENRKLDRRHDPLNRQLRKLPRGNLQPARQQAAFARRVLASRLPAPARAQKPRLLDGWQIRSIDGDTFAVGTERFRIRGIDAPETSEAGGLAATRRLELLLHGGPVLVIPYGQDAYGRTLAEVYVNNRNVADVMKEEGHDKPPQGK